LGHGLRREESRARDGDTSPPGTHLSEGDRFRPARGGAFPEHVEIVVKVTERCNIACSYCYFFFKEDQTYASRPAALSLDSCDALCRFLQEGVRECGLKSVRICFHGGEPLLMGRKRFDEVCRRITSAIGDQCWLRFTIQTNGMLIDDEWVALISKWNSGVGISLDGEKSANDAFRIDHKGRGTYERAAAGLKRLVKSGSEGRTERPSIISVINPSASGGRTYEHFRSEFDVRNFSFLFLNETHDTVTREIREGSFAFLEELTLAWLKEGKRDVRIRMLSENLACLMSDESMAALAPNKERLASVVSVRSDGDLGADDTVAALSPSFASTNMNISDQSLADVFRSPIWAELDDALHRPPSECRACEWYGLCRGGRIIHRYDKSGGFSQKSIYCDALKNLYTILSAYVIKHGVPRDVLKARLERSRGEALRVAEAHEAMSEGARA
ncbi:MAG: radical SAM protein, partial [Pseudomonadota bacterium]